MLLSPFFFKIKRDRNDVMLYFFLNKEKNHSFFLGERFATGRLAKAPFASLGCFCRSDSYRNSFTKTV